MGSIRDTFAYSIGKKLIMALTGLFLVTFLIAHLSGNLQLFKSDGGIAFNEYTKFMTTNPLIRVAEIIMFLGFFVHIFDGFLITLQNKRARPVGYVKKAGGKSSSWYSRNMAVTGSIIFIFLVLHLVNFFGGYKFGGAEKITINQAQSWKSVKDYSAGEKVVLAKGDLVTEEIAAQLESAGILEIEGISMYKIVVDAFKREWYVALYVIAMVLLALHLIHGFQSAFQSLGFNHKKYTPTIKVLGYLIAIVIPTAFAAIPVFIYLTQH